MESIGNDRDKLPPEVIESGWFGYPGATEEQIAQAEARLGTALPPSYRAFLTITNGWRQTTPFINRLWSTEEIDWFNVRHQKWLDALLEKSGYLSTPSDTNSSAPSIPDEEYFVYGDEQDCSKIRVEYLQTALEISQRGEAAIYLLNPQIVTETGEWEAWFLGDWLPGADRYRSFQDMMQAEYESFLELRDTPTVPTSGVASETPILAPTPSSEPTAITSLETKLIAEAPSEQLLEETDTKNHQEDKVDDILEQLDEWEKVASFTIEVQSRRTKSTEQRTIVHHLEAGTIAIYPNIITETVQQWISNQLNTMITQSREKSAGLEITELRVIRSPQIAVEMVANQAHPLFPSPIEIGEPFTLQVAIKVVGSTATKLADQQLVYRAQCFAHNLSTQTKSCLGDVVTSAPISTSSAYTARFPEMTLEQPGIYRLTVWVTLQNISASPGYFKVPILQVV
jgi:hypothetical protein